MKAESRLALVNYSLPQRYRHLLKVNTAAAVMLYRHNHHHNCFNGTMTHRIEQNRIIGVGDFGTFRRNEYLFLEMCIGQSNMVQISHIIVENDAHLFRSVLSVGDRPVRKFRIKLKKSQHI